MASFYPYAFSTDSFSIVAFDFGTYVTDDTGLQALLDPEGDGTGIRIIRKMDAGGYTSYYCLNASYTPLVQRWVAVLSVGTNADKATAIIAGMTIPTQPTVPPHPFTGI